MDNLSTADYEDIIAALAEASEHVSDYTRDRYNDITDKIVEYLETPHDV